MNDSFEALSWLNQPDNETYLDDKSRQLIKRARQIGQPDHQVSQIMERLRNAAQLSEDLAKKGRYCSIVPQLNVVVEDTRGLRWTPIKRLAPMKRMSIVVPSLYGSSGLPNGKCSGTTKRTQVGISPERFSTHARKFSNMYRRAPGTRKQSGKWMSNLPGILKRS